MENTSLNIETKAAEIALFISSIVLDEIVNKLKKKYPWKWKVEDYIYKPEVILEYKQKVLSLKHKETDDMKSLSAMCLESADLFVKEIIKDVGRKRSLTFYRRPSSLNSDFGFEHDGVHIRILILSYKSQLVKEYEALLYLIYK